MLSCRGVRLNSVDRKPFRPLFLIFFADGGGRGLQFAQSGGIAHLRLESTDRRHSLTKIWPLLISLVFCAPRFVAHCVFTGSALPITKGQEGVAGSNARLIDQLKSPALFAKPR